MSDNPNDPKLISDEAFGQAAALFPDKFVLVYVADRETKKASVRHNGQDISEQAAGTELMDRLAVPARKRR